METLLTPWGMLAVCTALAGVALFGAASRLPSLFPPSLIRCIGFGTMCASLAPLWALSGETSPVIAVGVVCLAAMVVIHRCQTRRAPETATLQEAPQEVEVTRYL